MKVERPNAETLTDAEMQELEQLRAMLEQAIADGIVTHDEVANIKAKVKQQKPRYELLSQELSLYRELVTDKVKAGLLTQEGITD